MVRSACARIGMSVPAMVILLACDAAGNGGDTPAFATRDSAGITIAENGQDDPPGVARWAVDSVPSMTIGVAMGDSAYEFNSVGGVQRLANGMIVVLNGQGEAAFELRFYDSTGRHIATHGRRGQGPGEHRWINFFGSVGGDTVIGVDFPNSRVNWVSASAGFLRSARLDENGFRRVLGDDAHGIVELMVPLGDSLYAVKAFRTIPGASSPFERGASFHIVDLNRNAAIDLVRYDEPATRSIRVSTGMTSLRPLDAGNPVHVVDRARRRICAGITTATEISCVDADRERLIIRWVAETVPYTDRDRRAYEDRARQGWRGMPPADIEARLAATDHPERHPPFTVLQLDTEGNFWILEYTLDASNERRSRFRVLNPEGRQIAFADSFPARSFGLGGTVHIGDTSVLRVLRDDDGVSTVGLFAIRKPE